MEHWLSQVGAANKHLTQRHAEYSAPAHDQQSYYTYEPSTPTHGYASSKHNYGGGSHKSNAAMSALTLLAFLFFLHILQQCLKEHMAAMTTPQVMVVSAGRDQPAAKTSTKLDKAGAVRATSTTETQPAANTGAGHAPSASNDYDGMFLTRIATAEHVPQDHKNKFVSYTDKSSVFDGFMSAMDDK